MDAVRIADLQTIATLCAGLLIAVGLVLRALPVGECAQCDHCRRERLEAAQRTFCPICLKQHAPGEPHR